MGFGKRPTLIGYVRTKELRRKLKFHLLDAIPISVSKKKPDHHVFEDTVDEDVDDLAQTSLAQFGIKRHRKSFSAPIQTHELAPIRRKRGSTINGRGGPPARSPHGSTAQGITDRSV